MNHTAPRPAVLIADDDEISRLFLIEMLEQAGFDVMAVADGAAALDAIRTHAFDLLLLDVAMPKQDGYQVCRFVRSTDGLHHLPVVMITGNDDANSIERAYDAGATDFIAKPVNWSLLPHRLRYILRNAEADRRVRHLAYYDPLTALPNAEALKSLVAAAIARTEASHNADGVALLYIGVPGCVRIRSTFGPEEGDEALRAFAERAVRCIVETGEDRERLFAARADGDRLVICLEARNVRDRALRLSEQLAVALYEPVRCGDHQFFLPPTMGIAHAPEHGRDARTLIMHAAAAKHHALSSGARGAVLYTDELGKSAEQRLSVEAALRQAVRAECLTLYFQPKTRLADGALVGVEALLRWFDPVLGEVSPGLFIPLAEESGLILDIGRWVIVAACRQLMNWRAAGFETSIAINMSARQFMHDRPAELIREAALASGVDPGSLVVEITESALIGDLASVRAGLAAVRALGCRVAIDDFGTGYSSLAYLKGLPVDELKIDRSFVRNLGSDAVDEAICAAILSLAGSVGLNVTAEGVEHDRQLQWLNEHGCNEAQGYLIARPMAAHRILSHYGPDQAARAADSDVA